MYINSSVILRCFYCSVTIKNAISQMVEDWVFGHCLLSVFPFFYTFSALAYRFGIQCNTVSVKH